MTTFASISAGENGRAREAPVSRLGFAFPFALLKQLGQHGSFGGGESSRELHQKSNRGRGQTLQNCAGLCAAGIPTMRFSGWNCGVVRLLSGVLVDSLGDSAPASVAEPPSHFPAGGVRAFVNNSATSVHNRANSFCSSAGNSG
jgi:hypothetical protein